MHLTFNTMSEHTQSFNILIEPHGWRFTANAGQSLLQAALAAGIVLPSSCRNGTCRTCLCQVQGGQPANVKYSIEWPGLSREEKSEGYILPCVASAQSDLVLHVPAAARL
ncbi:2Fe-2S iron-sulfur cluster-binding protein [Undibacterium sp.]|uniref:2Fe-2S iron-sulfur cluster-binding protein n=1 Tax=Undibacterium sp. TaxID=1914977 RepID=UPI00374D7CC5